MSLTALQYTCTHDRLYPGSIIEYNLYAHISILSKYSHLPSPLPSFYSRHAKDGGHFLWFWKYPTPLFVTINRSVGFPCAFTTSSTIAQFHCSIQYSTLDIIMRGRSTVTGTWGLSSSSFGLWCFRLPGHLHRPGGWGQTIKSFCHVCCIRYITLARRATGARARPDRKTGNLCIH